MRLLSFSFGCVVSCFLLGIAGAFGLSSAWGQDTGQPNSKYVITWNGKTKLHRRTLLESVEVIGDDGGNAVRLLDADMALTLGPQRELHFTGDEKSGKIFVRSPGQPIRLVGVEVKMTKDEEGNAVVLNPLASLSDVEIHDLWGVEINHWSDEVALKLNRIDSARTCVTIGTGVAISTDHKLPPLPKGLAFLRIYTEPEGLQQFDELKSQTSLRFLYVYPRDAKFDCSLLKQATQLQSLVLAECELTNSDSLAALTKLQNLSMSYCFKIDNDTFLATIPGLRSIDLGGTSIEDLGPLSSLTKLVKVDASESFVRRLPHRMPNLRELEIFRSDCSDEEVQRFRLNNPQCRVRHRFHDMLQTDLKSATRMRVCRTGSGPCALEASVSLFETANPDEFKQFIQGIQIIDPENHMGSASGCGGSPVFEFYEGDRLLTTVELIAAGSVGWDVWPTVAGLTDESADFVVNWLAKRNIAEPLEEHKKWAEHRREAKRKLLPESKRILFLGDGITASGQYITFLDAWLTTELRERAPTLINGGLPSETVSGLSEEGHAGGQFPRPDLAERLDRILKEVKPNLVISCYGMNCGIYQPFDETRFDRYREGMKKLQWDVWDARATFLVITPPFYDDQRAPIGFSYDAVLDRYSTWLSKQGGYLVDLHDSMTRTITEKRKTEPEFTLQPDGVHPNDAGHWFIAQQLIRWTGDDRAASAVSPKQMLANRGVPETVLPLFQQRMILLRDAYVSAAGHRRPGVAPGLPVAEANAKADELTKKIFEVLDAAKK